MQLVYIGILILMSAISFAIFYCTLFYIAVKLNELHILVNQKIELKKKASENQRLEDELHL